MADARPGHYRRGVPGGRILVVDDDPDTRNALALRLSVEGHDVIAAANGSEALEQLHANPRPDVILLDYAMPVMDGRAFREAQMREPRWATIPVVLITGQLQKSFGARSLDVAAVLEKPVSWEALSRLLDRFCRS
jgi:CheY-like chemotaxis protein